MEEDSSFFDVTLVLPDGERTIPVRSDRHIWDAAADAGIKLPALCHQGRCLTCAGRLIGDGRADLPQTDLPQVEAFPVDPFPVDQSDSVAYYPQDRVAGFVLLCTAKPRAALRILTHQAEQMRAFRKRQKLPAPYS